MMRANQAQTDPGSVRQRTLEILQQVTGDADVVTDPDLQLYGSRLLDSLATVSLIVAFEDAFGLVQILRKRWVQAASLARVTV